LSGSHRFTAPEREPAFAILKQTFGDRYLYAGLGTVLALGPTVGPTADARQSQAMDEDDLRSYRMLLAQSDDSPEKILAHSEHDSYRWLARHAH
jgi:7,8-dihydropterin-6-yl-methyl-4-(beta-D-ribofuranosyl)aminobenzene 5'-phosphate synthase